MDGTERRGTASARWPHHHATPRPKEALLQLDSLRRHVANDWHRLPRRYDTRRLQITRVKIYERVVRVLSAFDLGGELDKIAMRGARYGLPGWVAQQERKSGEPKPVYLDRGDAEAKAREFLASAKSAGDNRRTPDRAAGDGPLRRQAAVAQSGRSFYPLSPGRQLPYSSEVIDLLDAVATEKLPDHVLDRGREERDRQAAERAKDREDAAWYDEQIATHEAMSPDERQALLAQAGERFGDYDPRHWQLQQRIERLTADESSDSSEGGDAA